MPYEHIEGSETNMRYYITEALRKNSLWIWDSLEHKPVLQAGKSQRKQLEKLCDEWNKKEKELKT